VVEMGVTAKKGRKSVKVEVDEVSSMIDSDDEPLTTPKKSSAKAKVKTKTVLEEQVIPKQKASSAKRKVKTEDDQEGEEKAPKKRKTKEEKEAEAMPLAARTVVGSLKKAMHIGAHVSAAGGK